MLIRLVGGKINGHGQARCIIGVALKLLEFTLG